MSAAAPKPIDLAAWQLHLDFLLPRKELLRADEVAAACGLDERTVHRLFDDAQLPGHEFNAASGQRQHRRYRRAGVILLLASRANYAPADLREKLLEVLSTLPRPEMALLHQALGQLLSRP
jgi:AraC-like DNA-binding protein